MTNLETISASWSICDSFFGLAGTVALAISQGGPVTLVYGPIIAFLLVGACAFTLAELASVYPTAGGQYHWTSILAPRSTNRALVSCFTLVKETDTDSKNLRATAVGLRMYSPGLPSAQVLRLFLRSS